MINELENKIREILNRNSNLCVKIEQLKLEDNLWDYGFDSVSHVKAIVDIEIEFNIVTDDTDLVASKFPTVQSFITYVSSKL